MKRYDNDILLRVLAGEQTERPPVWLMRQAGRILPEYRAVRNSLSGFVELVKTPDLASEVTIQPVDRLGVDAAIIFSDILVIPECMGLPYQLIEKQGPYFPKTIESKADIDKLQCGASAASELNYVFDAIGATKLKLNGRVPLIGFSGAPWTLMSYMIEGKGSKTFSKAKAFLYKEPELAQQLIEKLTQTIIEYLKFKIRAGVDVVQVFDSWAGMLNKDLYNRFFIPSLKQIVDSITEVPVIVFSKGAHFAIKEIDQMNPNCIGLDWTMNINEVNSMISPERVIQGNLDPCVLYGSENEISKSVHKVLNSRQKGHIMNLGHGVYPDTPLENVQFMVNEVKNFNYQN